MTRRIFFEPAGRVHSTQRRLLLYPPEGYEFVIGETAWDKTINPVIKSNRVFHSSSLIRQSLEALVPLNLTKARLEGIFKKTPKDVDLTYAYNHLVFREEPWIVHVEWVHVLVGRNFRHFPRWKGLVEKMLASPSCKKILTWCELAKKAILLNLDCRDFADKIEVIPLAAVKKDFVKQYDPTRIRLLFVGSADASGDIFYNFDYKGGKEVLKVFDVLNKVYDNLELVMRSDIPDWVRKEYRGQPKIRFIDRPMPWEQLETEFKQADIFILPTHDTPWGAILEAMSYELPVVTIDARANSELVENRVTGFLANSSKNVPYYTPTLIPTGATSSRERLDEAIAKVDNQVVEQLTEKIRTLIENPDLRRRMGQAGRWKVEEGSFSIKSRNDKLKKVFDEATI